jgi:hypothetical protein
LSRRLFINPSPTHFAWVVLRAFYLIMGYYGLAEILKSSEVIEFIGAPGGDRTREYWFCRPAR